MYTYTSRQYFRCARARVNRFELLLLTHFKRVLPFLLLFLFEIRSSYTRLLYDERSRKKKKLKYHEEIRSF